MWFDFIAKHAQAKPEHIAVIGTAGQPNYTYADLHHESQRWVGKLQSYGILAGARVAILATNRIEHLILFFACARLRASLVPLNFRLSKRELQEQINRLEQPLLIADKSYNWRNVKGHINIDQPNLPKVGPTYRDSHVEDEDILMMLFTSGSTGTPKAVMLSARMLIWNAINTQTGWQLTAEDRSIVQTPFFHTGGWNVLCLPLLRLGGSIVLDQGNFDPENTLKLLYNHQISFYFGVPTMFSMLLEHPNFNAKAFASVRFCISGGAPCPTPLIAKFRQLQVPLKQGFGLTECGPNCFYLSDEEAQEKPESVGRPMLHSKIVLRDDQGIEVQQGETGELCITGPHVCSGYWQMEGTFNQVFRDGFFHTGDLMRRDSDGCFYVVGRKKEMYISGGENVYPGEVERQLSEHPDIDEVSVVSVPHDKWGEVGFAFYRGQQNLTLEILRSFLTERLSRYKHPHYLQHIEQWPLLPNGKINRKKLQQQACENAEAAHV
jgi:fatty-acyl-CoA synthase